MELRHRRGRPRVGGGRRRREDTVEWASPSVKDLGGPEQDPKVVLHGQKGPISFGTSMPCSPPGPRITDSARSSSFFLPLPVSSFPQYPFSPVEPSLRSIHRASTLIIIARHSEMRPRCKCGINRCNSPRQFGKSRTIRISSPEWLLQFKGCKLPRKNRFSFIFPADCGDACNHYYSNAEITRNILHEN